MKTCVMTSHVRHSERGSGISECLVGYMQRYTSRNWLWGGPPFCREQIRTIIAHLKVAHIISMVAHGRTTECVTHAFSCDTYIVTSHPVQTLWINCIHTHAMDVHFESINCTLAILQCCQNYITWFVLPCFQLNKWFCHSTTWGAFVCVPRGDSGGAEL